MKNNVRIYDLAGEEVELISTSGNPQCPNIVVDSMGFAHNYSNSQLIIKKESESETITAWIARDMDGKILMYADKPYRHTGDRECENFWHKGGTYMLLPDETFPEQRWEDEASEVEITITKKEK